MQAEAVTIGELGRRVDRLDQQVHEGFEGLRREIQALAFVPAAVYASDRSADQERIRRLEQDITDERDARESATKEADRRGWQARLSIVIALIGLPLSILGSVIVALLLANVGG